MRANTLLLAAALVAAAGLLAKPALAASGTVVDREGKPVAGARACVMVGEAEGDKAEGLCVDTDARGYYRLPAPRSPAGVRIAADGFLPATVAALDQESPVVLDLAAILFARVFDAKTGLPVPKSEVEIVYTTGERKGPFPANRNGVRVKSLPPGSVIPKAKADGYAAATGAAVVLAGGKETAVEFKLQPR